MVLRYAVRAKPRRCRAGTSPIRVGQRRVDQEQQLDVVGVAPGGFGVPPACEAERWRWAAGAVWRLLATEGDRVAAGQPLLVLETMRAEITVAALRCCDGATVAIGQRLLDLA